ncbi:MAG: transposase family protein [Caldilineaceae bacterium]|nr:transposase family protein [Caldilineaceae bacterium]
MEYIVACPDPELLATLCAFTDQLATRPDPRDPRGVRHALPVLLSTLLLALAGANSLAAVAAFTHDHRAWFLLWLLDGTSLPGLEELILALNGKAARRSCDLADGTRPLHMVSAFLVREGLTRGPGAVRRQEQ